jgi:hypothetical protein
MSTSTKSKTLVMGDPTSPLAGVRITTIDRSATLPTEAERMDQFRLGCKRLRADEQTLAEIDAILTELSILEDLQAEKNEMPISTAATKAGKAAYKTLGRDCFPGGEREAIGWAFGLPLTEAREQARLQELERLRVDHERETCRHRFWEKAAAVAQKLAHYSRLTMDEAKMIDEVMFAGKP